MYMPRADPRADQVGPDHFTEYLLSIPSTLAIYFDKGFNTNAQGVVKFKILKIYALI